ncbi:TetR/AcrR family transcriptional regulator [Pseudonocardia sp.]|uniref:TetR/AcrR family transcriptional regulator n=1 Tax=Pseudonocardia sp. TaxID=60912 RepID=UPI003D0AB080
MAAEARERLLERVLAYAAQEGITGRSLRDIARGTGTSHRMLLYHFGSREGLLAAIVAAVEARQRALMTDTARRAADPAEVMTDLWARVSDPAMRPSVALFFEVFGLVVQGAPGTEELRAGLTRPWLDDAAAAAEALGIPPDPAGVRLGIAVTRGLLMELLAGADGSEVDAAYRRFVELMTAPH